MRAVALEKAQATLPDLLKPVAGGEEFTLTQNGRPNGEAFGRVFPLAAAGAGRKFAGKNLAFA
jgi:antitoxin (DNA-binding transcriptional repressor) of toxin-antitoxin stability system